MGSMLTVEHRSFTKTESSARIKTWAARSGSAQNIFFEHLTLDGVESAIEIDQNYFGADSQQNGGVKVSRVHFTDVQGSGEKILLICAAQSPCQEIVIKGVNVAPSTSKPVEVVCTMPTCKTPTIMLGLRAPIRNGGVKVSRVHFTDVQGSGEKILLICAAQSPCQEIVIKGVNVASSTSNPVEVVCTHANVQDSEYNPRITCSN